jgi:hypothetical protein
MFIEKLGLLTCALYVALTVLFQVGLWVLIRFKGFGFLYRGKHPSLALGVSFGAIFGLLWLISFIAAWSFVYPDIKSIFSVHPD